MRGDRNCGVMSASIFKITRTRLLKCSTSLRASSRLYSAQVAHSSPLTDTEPPPTSSSTTLDTNASISATSEQPYQPTRTARAKPRKLQSLAQLQTPRKSILEPTGVDIYLSKLQAAGLEPTLADLERCRPRRHVSHTSSQYPEEYRRLVDTLCRSFSKDQLRMFLEMYGADTIWSRPRRRKAEYAEAIMEKQWDWPCLKEIERAKRDKTEVVAKCMLHY